ncbi:MAG: ribosome maturation factor RimM [Alicyclobacillus sp.]|nr:ribosome maturation factor RimM [Alicyclobacillus sp.]
MITGTHALRGEVRVLPKTDFPEKRFRQGSRLYVRRTGESPIREVVVRSGRPHKQFWLVAFDGLSSINDVEHWRGYELCIHQSQLDPLPDGMYYIHQLLGLRVVTDDGRLVGKLVEVLTPGANDVYVVRGPMQKKDVLLPAIRDCILNVDLPSQTMTVHLLPGLLEADTEPDS